MSTLGSDIIKGLQEALAYAQGDPSHVTVHRIAIAKPCTFTPEEIKEIRKDSKMTQGTFAACIGITKKCVESWECGRTKPSGAALRMLCLMHDIPACQFICGVGNARNC